MSRQGENRGSRNRETQRQAKDKHDWERGENKEEEKPEKNRQIRYKNRREVSGGSRHAVTALIAYSLWQPGATVESSDQVSRSQTRRRFLTPTTLWQKRPRGRKPELFKLSQLFSVEKLHVRTFFATQQFEFCSQFIRWWNGYMFAAVKTQWHQAVDLQRKPNEVAEQQKLCITGNKEKE